ncbi:uncharacterized protein LOC135222534 [Macrobrachium nipponense]|uniref:uncharacterized protein LOC135222534 n=1 Tax=Macrobrachium nipponense TaxID=159736 RepID=UPI0030C7D7F6
MAPDSLPTTPIIRRTDTTPKVVHPQLPSIEDICGTLRALAAYEGLWDLLRTKIYYSDYSSLVVGTPSDYQSAKQSLYLFWDEEEEDDEDIARLLSHIPALDWSRPVFLSLSPLSLVRKVSCLPVVSEDEEFERNCEAFQSLWRLPSRTPKDRGGLNRNGHADPPIRKGRELLDFGLLGHGLLKPSEAFILQLYVMSSLPSIDIRLPKGFDFRDLTEEHAEFLLDYWEYKHASTPHKYRCMRRVLPGIGVFKTSDGNANNEGAENGDQPVAWAQLSFWNMYTNTFTLPQYRRQGLAAMATLALARKSLEKTGLALAPISANNAPSAGMHLKLGFKPSIVIANQSYSP